MKITKLFCHLPESIRAFFFRTLDHRWKTTYLSQDGSACEQQCTRCETRRHYLPQHCKPDGMSAEWQPGPLRERQTLREPRDLLSA